MQLINLRIFAIMIVVKVSLILFLCCSKIAFVGLTFGSNLRKQKLCRIKFYGIEELLHMIGGEK